jgi:hypothetical protein
MISLQHNSSSPDCQLLTPHRLFDFDKSDEYKAYMRNVELPPGDKALLKVKAKWYKRTVVGLDSTACCCPPLSHIRTSAAHFTVTFYSVMASLIMLLFCLSGSQSSSGHGELFIAMSPVS